MQLLIEMQNSTQDILSGESHLSLDVDQWKQAIQLMANSENRSIVCDAIRAWVSRDPENRSAYHSELMDMVSSAVEVKSNTIFDPAYCGTKATLSNDYKRIVYRDYGWHCSAMGTRCTKYSIRLIRNCTYLLVGMAPKPLFEREGNNFKTCGWYMYCAEGTLYSQDGEGNNTYIVDQACNANGTVIGVQLENGELSFSLNGVDMGVAFRGLPVDVFPAFDMYDNGCEFEFI